MARLRLFGERQIAAVGDDYAMGPDRCAADVFELGGTDLGPGLPRSAGEWISPDEIVDLDTVLRAGRPEVSHLILEMNEVLALEERATLLPHFSAQAAVIFGRAEVDESGRGQLPLEMIGTRLDGGTLPHPLYEAVVHTLAIVSDSAVESTVDKVLLAAVENALA